MRFALNHMVAPRQDFCALASLARELGLDAVELRNDLPGVPLQDGSPTASVRDQATAAGVSILGINALQRFEQWDDVRRTDACALADQAWGCGASAIVLCPTNDRQDARAPGLRARDLRHALEALLPILSERGLQGLVEPLGFPQSALRTKRDAVCAIRDVDGSEVFGLLHDTFHHFLAGETGFFPEHTGLVHISGVEDPTPAVDELRDGHRVLVSGQDRVGNIAQLRGLLDGGYAGAFSFEPFSDTVHTMPDPAPALRESMALIERATVRACPA